MTATATTITTVRMDVGAAAVTAIPTPAPAIEPDVVLEPWIAAIDDSGAAYGDDAAGPGELQAD